MKCNRFLTEFLWPVPLPDALGKTRSMSNIESVAASNTTAAYGIQNRVLKRIF
jgi:hypothetical protein